VNAAPAIATAVVFTWLGMVLAISRRGGRPRSGGRHAYVALEVVKALALLATGTGLLAG
jgi:hypothetical protein